MAQLSGAAAKLDALKWRCIGPPRGGRVVAVAGDPKDRGVFYFGACAGGVWKTIDGGIYWRCVSDGFFGSAAIGALAVAPSDPNVIYAGTGETEIRLDVSYGDGVYKSTDAGGTWCHLGLRESRFVGRICIHPHDPDLVYVAALGDVFGANEERGVFRSRDGGRTWSKVLYRDANTGAVDLAMDPRNPGEGTRRRARGCARRRSSNGQESRRADHSLPQGLGGRRQDRRFFRAGRLGSQDPHAHAGGR